MERYICIHGHFYQPPRENPWLEAVELQDSAYPYHNWNAKITAECYAPNATSRILDDQDRILRIVNNYSKMSFNFGPTLLAWLEINEDDVYKAVLEADRESQANFSGHGSALAQAYNHMILPLANARDKYTQVLWGIRDFEHRFGRKPEGMWLPETAVNVETLEVLVDLGILFTILAPRQAKAVRRIGDTEWQDVSNEKIDPTMAYTFNLPSGGSIAIFFYDGPISRAVAFEGLLSKGESFAQRLISSFSGSSDRPQLVHIATDGESYGHHHRFGDMALAYAVNYIESNNLAKITNYGEYLEKYPPIYEVQIFENSSWSCTHGLERWRSDCGCNSGAHPGWNQAWRKPLREALDSLRDELSTVYEQGSLSHLKDPWAARNDYIHVVLNRSPQNIENFLGRHAAKTTDAEEKTYLLHILEMQRHAMLMYTSCGWFFDDISGIETIQILQYGSSAIQLAQSISGNTIESRFLQILGKAKSNVPEYGNGLLIYDKFIKPAKVNLEKVGAHYAISSLFEEYGEKSSIFCFTVDRQDYQSVEAGMAKLVVGRVTVTSEITFKSKNLCFGVLHFGDHNLNCGVREFKDEKTYQTMVRKMSADFAGGDLTETLKCLDKQFGASTFSLKSLFRDEQRNILNTILESTLNDSEVVYRLLYERHEPMMRFLKDLGIPAPHALRAAAELALSMRIRRALENVELDVKSIKSLMDEAKKVGISLDLQILEYVLRNNLETIITRFSENPEDIQMIKRLDRGLELLPSLPFQLNLIKLQNTYYALLKAAFPGFVEKAEKGDEKAGELVNVFRSVGAKLRFRIEDF